MWTPPAPTIFTNCPIPDPSIPDRWAIGSAAAYQIGADNSASIQCEVYGWRVHLEYLPGRTKPWFAYVSRKNGKRGKAIDHGSHHAHDPTVSVSVALGGSSRVPKDVCVCAAVLAAYAKENQPG